MTKDFFSRLRFRLILLVLLAVLPALGVIVYLTLHHSHQAKQDAQGQALVIAKTASNLADNIIVEAQNILFTLSQVPQVQRGDKEACEAIFSNILKSSQRFISFNAVGLDGVPFAGAPPITAPVSFADRPWFRRVMEKKSFVISEYLIGRRIGQPILAFAHPVFDPREKLSCIIVAGLDLRWLSQFIAKVGLPGNISLRLVDRNGTVLARYPEIQDLVGKKMSESPMVQAMLTRKEGVLEGVGLDGVERLYGFTSLGANGGQVYVSVGLPQKEVLANVYFGLKIGLAALGIVAFLALGAAWFMGGALVLNPVNSLLEVTHRLADGDLSARTGPPYIRGEIGELAQAFDQMAASLEQRDEDLQQALEELGRERQSLEGRVQERTLELKEANVQLTRAHVELEQRIKERTRELQKSEEKYRNIFNNSQAGVYRTRISDGKILEANPRLAQIFGYQDQEEFINEFLAPAHYVDPGTRDRMLAILKEKGELDNFEARFYRKDGSIFWLLFSARIYPEYLEGIALDITERKQAEEGLRETRNYLENLLDYANAPIIVWDPEFRITRFNHAFEHLSGYAAAAVLGQKLDLLFPEASRDASMAKIERTLVGEYWKSVEIPILRKDGEIRMALWNSANIYAGDGATIAATIAQGQDITERKRAEEELDKSNRLQKVINSLLFLSLTNRPLAEIFSRTLEEIFSIPWISSEPRGMVFLVDNGARHLRLETHMNIPEARQQACARVPFGDCYCGLAASTREIQFGDHYEPHLLLPESDQPHCPYSVPIIFEDQPLGVINIYLAADQTRDPRTEEFLRAIANTLAGIIVRRRTDKGLKEALERLQRNLYQTLESLATALEKRDVYTAGHQRRVAELAGGIARHMGLPAEIVESVELAAHVHDIGKLYVPADILTKPSKLKPMEMGLVKDHPQAGYEILKNVEFPWPIAEIILQHHERLDGSGYPQGLAGEQIRLEARILAVADVVEAMSSHRPYRPALGIDEALEEIRQNKGITYDAEVVDACIKFLTEKDPHSLEAPSPSPSLMANPNSTL